MYSDINLEYESGRHLTDAALENTFINVLSGDYQSSAWPDVSWAKVGEHSPSTLGVDGLSVDMGQLLIDPENEYTEEEEIIVERLTVAAASWLALPDSVNSLNDSDSILQVHGDLSLGGKQYLTTREVFIASLIPVLALSSAVTAIRAGADYRTQKKSDAEYNQIVADYNRSIEDMRSNYGHLGYANLGLEERVTSRRHFLKAFAGSLVTTALVVNGSLNFARILEAGNTPLQGAGEFVVDKTPGILYPDRDAIIGRTALVAEKTEEAVNLFDAPTDRAAILFGNAHSIGVEVVDSKKERTKAIRKLAGIYFKKLNSDENRDKDYTQQDVVEKMADTRAVVIEDIEAEAVADPVFAMMNSIRAENRYLSPAVIEDLDSWDPSE